MNPTDDDVEFHLGGCLCAHYELRITERCLIDDLGMPPDVSFEQAIRHPIVQSFHSRRQDVPTGGKTVGPEAGENTLYHLGSGDDHRGATWFEAEQGVVWLCAYGFHRSGEADDAFQLFSHLLESDEIYPAAADYRALRRDRAQRFNDLAPRQGASANADAIQSPNTVIERSLGHQFSRLVQVRLIANVVDDVAEISIAFSPVGLSQAEIVFVVACFATDGDDPEWVNELAGNSLLPGEIAFRLLTAVE